MANLFVKQLTVIDCSYLHSARGLLGESWIVDIELVGALNKQGMLLDFGDIKRTLKNAIDAFADHKLLVPCKAPELKRLENQGEQFELEYIDKNGRRYLHCSPKDALCIVPVAHIEADSMRHTLQNHIQNLLPKNITDLQLTIRTETSGPLYQYSHGLKKHEGNCQRIAHGHRSRLEIWENGSRASRWEQYWAEKWHDVYIGTREDCVSLRDTSYKFSYTAEQGEFTLQLPKECCYLIDTDSTVEHIAAHLAEQMRTLAPDTHFKIFVFEGVNKGATAETQG